MGYRDFPALFHEYEARVIGKEQVCFPAISSRRPPRPF
jgi:hypothetical protein